MDSDCRRDKGKASEDPGGGLSGAGGTASLWSPKAVCGSMIPIWPSPFCILSAHT